MGGATLRPNATGWRSGQDNQQHAPADSRRAVCAAPVREPRYDRPDWPRCTDCIAIVGITVTRPPESEGELREAFGK